MFKTCAKRVGSDQENPRTTFHSFPNTHKTAAALPHNLTQSPAAYAPNRTHFVHSLVGKITGVTTHLSTQSTLPTTAITIYI